jgi:hypothetical protein
MFSRFFKKARPADQREHYRRAPGKKATLGVRLVLPTGETVPGELLDVSAGGAAVRFDMELVSALPLETTCELRFTSLTKGQIKIQATVRGVPRAGAPNRFGFQFVDQGELFRQLDDSFYKYFNRRCWARAQPALDRRVTAKVVLGESALDIDVYDVSREGVSFVLPAEVAETIVPDTSLEVTIPVPRADAAVTFYGLVRHKTSTTQGWRIGCALQPADAKSARRNSKKDLAALDEFIAKRVEEMERYNAAYL